MINPNQKEFSMSIERNDGTFHPFLITIRKANQKEIDIRRKFLLKLKDETISNIKGFLDAFYPKLRFSGLYPNQETKKFQRWLEQNNSVDDQWNRVNWIMRYFSWDIKDQIVKKEIALTLVTSNFIKKNGEPVFKFVGDYVADNIFLENAKIITKIQGDIYEKVLELNPEWAGENERLEKDILNQWLPKQHKGTFSDLNPKSIFSRSETQLLSLMNEVNEQVFDSIGTIKINVPMKTFQDQGETFEFLTHLNPPPKNIILYYSATPSIPVKTSEEASVSDFLSGLSNLVNYGRHENQYLGLIEHGKFEIRIVARKEKFSYWDTDLDGIEEGLRKAVVWLEKNGLYTYEERQNMAIAQDYQDAINEGKAFLEDLREYGISDDD